ncbi:MAG: hypothetical protein E6276_01080 [Clostridiales bacterium]|nr:hypothetical protein [Clostridiales bacterium]
MQEDLAYCVEQFNDFMKLIDVDIQNGQLTREKIMMVELAMSAIFTLIKKTMIKALWTHKGE